MLLNGGGQQNTMIQFHGKSKPHSPLLFYRVWSQRHELGVRIIFNRAAFLDRVCDLETPTTHSLIVRTFIESNQIPLSLVNQNEYFSQVYNEVNDHQAQ